MAEEFEEPVRVVDIKHYLYCPRIVYFDRVAKAEERVFSQQSKSLEEHERLEKLEKRRVGGFFYSGELVDAEKVFQLRLRSERLNLEGVLDCLLRLGKEAVPVDYKYMRSMRGRAWLDHRYQLTAYALLVEDKLDCVVRRGFIYYVPEDRVVEVSVDEGMKRYVKRLIKRVEYMMHGEELPPVRVPPSKCAGCGFFWICRRV